MWHDGVRWQLAVFKRGVLSLVDEQVNRLCVRQTPKAARQTAQGGRWWMDWVSTGYQRRAVWLLWVGC